jgi:hypothetical protein
MLQGKYDPRLSTVGKCLVVAATLAACATPSHAATPKLTPKVDGDAVVLLTTSAKPVRCEAVVKYTYFDKLSGKRENGWTSFGYFTTKPGKNVEYGRFSDPTMSAPIINGDVVGGCNNDNSKRESEKSPEEKAADAKKEGKK